MTIEANIRAWLASITGVTVVQAPYSGPRNTAPYVTYKIIAIAPMANGYKRNVVGDKLRRYTHAAITVSVNAYADGGYSMLCDVLSANDWQDARILLADDGARLAFIGGSAPQNLTALGDTDYRSRWQTDLTIYADLTHDRTLYLIDQLEIAGEWTSGDGDIIEISSAHDNNTARLEAGIEVAL